MSILQKMNFQITEEANLKLAIGQQEFLELLKQNIDRKRRLPTLRFTGNSYQGFIAGNKFYLTPKFSVSGELDSETELEGKITDQGDSISIELRANPLKHVIGYYLVSFALVIIGLIAATVQADWRFLMLVPCGFVAYLLGIRTGRHIASKAIERLIIYLKQNVKSR